jgi:hypothetical protein
MFSGILRRYTRSLRGSLELLSESQNLIQPIGVFPKRNWR